jgi:uncharacterized protein HemX
MTAKEAFVYATNLIRTRAKTNQAAIGECAKKIEALQEQIDKLYQDIDLLRACEREDTLLADMMEVNTTSA